MGSEAKIVALVTKRRVRVREGGARDHRPTRRYAVRGYTTATAKREEKGNAISIERGYWGDKRNGKK